LAAFDQLGQPSVVHVARQIACGDAPMPKAGNQHQRGNSKNLEVVTAHE